MSVLSKNIKDYRNSAELDQKQYRCGAVNRLKHTVYNDTEEIVQLNPIQYLNAILLYSQCPLIGLFCRSVSSNIKTFLTKCFLLHVLIAFISEISSEALLTGCPGRLNHHWANQHLCFPCTFKTNHFTERLLHWMTLKNELCTVKSVEQGSLADLTM